MWHLLRLTGLQVSGVASGFDSNARAARHVVSVGDGDAAERERWCRSSTACLQLLRNQALSTDQWLAGPVAQGGLRIVHGGFQSASAPVCCNVVASKAGAWMVPVSTAVGRRGMVETRARAGLTPTRRSCWAGGRALASTREIDAGESLHVASR